MVTPDCWARQGGLGGGGQRRGGENAVCSLDFCHKGVGRHVPVSVQGGLGALWDPSFFGVSPNVGPHGGLGVGLALRCQDLLAANFEGRKAPFPIDR